MTGRRGHRHILVATEIKKSLLKVLDGKVVPLKEEIADTALEVTARKISV